MDCLPRNVITVLMDLPEAHKYPVKAQYEVSQLINHLEESEVTVDLFLIKKQKEAFQKSLNQLMRTVSAKNRKRRSTINQLHFSMQAELKSELTFCMPTKTFSLK